MRYAWNLCSISLRRQHGVRSHLVIEAHDLLRSQRGDSHVSQCDNGV